MKFLSLLVLIIALTGCTIGQRKMAARTGATYGTVKILKSMKVSAEKADKISEIAKLALSGDKEKIKDALALVISKEFEEEEQIILLTFLDDLGQALVDLSNHDGEIMILIRATAEGVILGVAIYKRSLTGQWIPIYRSFA